MLAGIGAAAIAFSADARAEDPSLLIHRYTEEPAHGWFEKGSGGLSCVATQMSLLKADGGVRVRFASVYRARFEDPLLMLKEGEKAALDEMLRRKVLDAREAGFHEGSTAKIDPGQITFIDRLVPSGPGPGTIPIEGKHYRRSAVLRLVSAQEFAEVARDGRSVSRTRFHSLPWMQEFPDFWRENSSRFAGKSLFELGRAAQFELGTIEDNLKYATWVAIREQLMTARSSADARAAVARGVIFVHSTRPANTELYKIKYGFKELPGPPGADPRHRMLWISLEDLERRFPLEKHLPDLAEAMEHEGTKDPTVVMRLLSDSLLYRSTFLRARNARGAEIGAPVVIHDRTILSLARVYEESPRRDEALRFYRMAQESLQSRPLDVERELARRIGFEPPRDRRVWWEPRGCGRPDSCTFRDVLKSLFQVEDHYRREFTRMIDPGFAARELSKIAFLTADLGDLGGIGKATLEAAGIQLAHHRGDVRVLRVPPEALAKLRQANPAIAADAASEPLGISVLDFKKRLTVPNLDTVIRL